MTRSKFVAKSATKTQAWFLASLCGLTISASLKAQDSGSRKPPPPTEVVARPSGPGPEFLAAYRQAGRPTLAVVEYIRPSRDGPRDVETAEISMLGGRTREHFRSSQVTLLPESATARVANRNDIAEVAATDPRQAARVIADEAKADIVITLTLVPQEGRNDGVKYLAHYAVIDVRRDQIVAEWPFEMYPRGGRSVLDATDMSYYADAIADDIKSKFIEFYASPDSAIAGIRYEMSFSGELGFADTQSLTALLQRIPGVQDVQLRRAQSIARDAYRAEYQLWYTGRGTDLAYSLQSGAWTELGKWAALPSFRDGKAEVTLGTLPASESPWLHRATANNSQARQALAEAYRAAGEPKVGVLVSRMSGDNSTWVWWRWVRENWNSDQTKITFTDDTTSLREYGAATMQNSVLKRLSDLGIACVDEEQLRAAILRDKERLSQISSDEDLAKLVERELGVQILLTGDGSVFGTPAQRSVSFTFRAKSTSDGRVLAATDPSTRLLDASPNAVEAAAPAMADELAAQIVDGLISSWTSSRRLSVLVTDVRTPDDLTKLRGSIEKLTGVTGTKFYELDRAKDNAIARFDVMYSGDADKLLEAIRSINEPGFVFDMNAGTRDRVTIRLKNQ
ncbi:MAG: hypothetical protein JNL50_08090 [Phycisphaerae bacterium]|nr:hypothetical protein [Phycisphaerae bacterium]